MKKKILLGWLVFAIPVLLAAEEDSLKTRTFQVSLLTPLGTNGLDSWNVKNKISFNLLAGYGGGVSGAEFNGLFSVLRTDMNGAQFSGLGSIVKGTARGVQFSGLGTFVKGSIAGVQFSGLGSVVGEKTRGVQFSGLFNINGKKVSGAQFAGLINIAGGPLAGVQLAGLANITSQVSKGLQFAGLVNLVPGGRISQVSGILNITTKETKGIQVTGLLNIATDSLNGAQVAGLASVNAGKMQGVQVSGLTNINSGRLRGLQIAGLLNYTRKLYGVQIGVLNVVDSVERGVPVGFLSFAGNGYRTFEIAASENFYGMISFKTGVRKFYNILSTGIRYRHDMVIWGWGYGLGGMITLSDKWDLAIEGTCYQVNEGEWFTNRLNLLNRLSVTGSFRLSKHLALFGGISWNVTVAKITDKYGEPVGSYIAPWSVFDEVYDGHINVKMYPGVMAGIRL